MLKRTVYFLGLFFILSNYSHQAIPKTKVNPASIIPPAPLPKTKIPVSDKGAIVYLCGITPSWASEREVLNRNILTENIKNLGYSLIAVKPKNTDANGNFYWPRDNSAKINSVYSDILQEVGKTTKVIAYIGFSNGGSFLNQLAQLIELKAPVISIGSEGTIEPACKFKNRLYLIAGTKDTTYLPKTEAFANELKQKKSTLNSSFAKFEGAHEITNDGIQQAFKTLDIK